MVELKINGRPVTVEDGATVLDAATQLGIEIPTLCHLKGSAPETSCMLCVVKNVETGQLIPSCSAKAVEGLSVDTECAAVQDARRDILNLLLSEHVGDCEAPCTRICPAHLDIPHMLRAIEHGDMEQAGWIAKRDLVLPVTLGHICPAPCEKGCRRGQLDSSITIRDLHREAGRATAPKAPKVERAPVAVLGSGAAGLACAWQLLQLGYAPSVFDAASLAGGTLRNHPDLPAEVLDAELQELQDAGIVFRLDEAGPANGDFSAVLEPEEHKLAVMAVANGKKAAQEFHGGAIKRFDSKIGKLRESEVTELVKNCSAAGSAQDAGEMQAEAARCLHCDCRKPVSCKLRNYAERYGADQREFPADERGHVQLIGHGEAVIFEPGKCIKCGLCVKITQRAGEELGVTFVGRGYNMRVAVPFSESLQAGLKRTAAAVVAACPTGALAFREGEE
jgi:ferredoxin